MFRMAELSQARTCRRGARGNATPAAATGTIEAAYVPLPHYASEEFAAIPDGASAPSSMENGGGGHQHEERKGGMAIVKSCSKAGHEKCNGIPWTKEKHGFVVSTVLAGAGQVQQGLVDISRTPTQVAKLS